ncbi:MAG: hypothetical protein KDA54_00595 [Phycisphaerales bacterium]|nr:hypothetical protein [Phycisphaerales bacterium]
MNRRLPEQFRRVFQSVTRLALILPVCLAMIAGCKQNGDAHNEVVAMFGSLGLGPGQFSYPRALTVDSQNRIFVVDKSARIQRFSPEGTFQLGWSMPERVAGKPVGLYAHTDGKIYVPDTHYHRVMVFDPDGHELARFGREGYGDGEFQLPTDVAIDKQGFIYVSEYNGNDRVTKWSPSYEFVSVVCAGEIDGEVMRRPAAMDIDNDGTLWVADACNHRILHFSLDGRFLSSWGEMGGEPGQLRYPYDIDCLDDGTILVCEFGNHRLQWFDREGNSIRIWGEQGRGKGELWAPWGAVVRSDGRVCVVDSLNARVQILEK